MGWYWCGNMGYFWLFHSIPTYPSPLSLLFALYEADDLLFTRTRRRLSRPRPGADAGNSVAMSIGSRSLFDMMHATASTHSAIAS